MKKQYKYEIRDNLVYITLYSKKNNEENITVIDLFNLDKFLSHKYAWHLVWEEDIENYYVKSCIYLGIVNGKPKYKIVYLHKFLTNIPEENYGDHINHNSLDNRIDNIREIENGNNIMNRKSKNSNNTSGYRNVTLIDRYWRVQLQINKKNYLFPEKFTDVDEAGAFAEEMRQKHYGEFAGNN